MVFPLDIHAVFSINMRQRAAKLLQGISRRTGETPPGIPFGLRRNASRKLLRFSANIE
jgi:hypothetical protein